MESVKVGGGRKIREKEREEARGNRGSKETYNDADDDTQG
jgi:hypothetical protein